MTLPDAVRVEAPARLHFGVLDLNGALGRRFGGIGAAVPVPSLVLDAVRASGVEAAGPDAQRAASFARRFLDHYEVAGGVRLAIERVIPPHAGLGSGTQMALAVGRALAELYGLPKDPGSIARAVGRGQRSAIGTWAFEHGGFILEGGRKAGDGAVAPLLLQRPMPEAWRCVIALPEGRPGLSGEEEARAFNTLAPPPVSEVQLVSYLVLLQMLPALVEADLASFGGALTRLQEVTGGWFATSQGGPFAAGASAELVARMRGWGVPGVGQSSWGPTVYGLVAGADAASDLAARVRADLGHHGQVWETGFSRAGARISVTPAPAFQD